MKMIKLTKIFKINANFGDIVEICKEFNNKKVCVPFLKNEVKFENGEIFVSEKAFNKHIKFFRTIADC
jgi:uncharacterized membrane protein YvbJ